MDRHELLAAARSIGRRIVAQALWQGPRCTWEVKVQDRERPAERCAITRPAAGTLYQGTAGIACFLGELYRLSGEPEVGRAAEGAIRHALEEAAELPEASFGFHTGRVGIAYVAARLAEILDRPELGVQALEILEPLAGKESRDRRVDVIGGAAGAIPALVELSRTLGNEQLLDVAGALGDHLIAVAHREPGGWSWLTIGESVVRHLTGLAHGTAGVGLALLELHRATGRGRYRFAAEMAFLYERQFFDPATSNWPDLRHTEISEWVFSGRREELRQAAADGAIPPYERRYMTAWCYGSPGIGLARVRAFELTGQLQYKQEAEAALASTLESLAPAGGGSGNFSLCHGLAGTCELPLEAAAVFGDPSLREACERHAASGWERYEQAGRPWPCGTIGGEADPSLMLGEAGIGYFYLRLFAPETPSILLLRPPPAPPPEGAEEESFEEESRTAVEEYFGQTLRSFAAVEQPPVHLSHRRDASAPLAISPVEAAYETLRQRVDEERGALREKLADTFRRERERYELTLELSDFTEEFVGSLTRRPPAEVRWQNGRFRLPQHHRLVATEWDWESWLAAREKGVQGASLPAAEVPSLLYRQGNRIHIRKIKPLAALVLNAVETPSSLDEIVARVAGEVVGGEKIDPEEMAAKVLAQVQQLYQAGFVDWSSGGESR